MFLYFWLDISDQFRLIEFLIKLNTFFNNLVLDIFLYLMVIDVQQIIGNVFECFYEYFLIFFDLIAKQNSLFHLSFGTLLVAEGLFLVFILTLECQLVFVFVFVLRMDIFSAKTVVVEEIVNSFCKFELFTVHSDELDLFGLLFEFLLFEEIVQVLNYIETLNILVFRSFRNKLEVIDGGIIHLTIYYCIDLSTYSSIISILIINHIHILNPFNNI